MGVAYFVFGFMLGGLIGFNIAALMAVIKEDDDFDNFRDDISGGSYGFCEEEEDD